MAPSSNPSGFHDFFFCSDLEPLFPDLGEEVFREQDFLHVVERVDEVASSVPPFEEGDPAPIPVPVEKNGGSFLDSSGGAHRSSIGNCWGYC